MKLLKPIRSSTGFVVVPVHYSHDPEKRSDEWRLQEIAKYRRESFDWERTWNQEMELDFSAVAGSPAYPNFRALNVRSNLVYNPELPLCLCCDFNIEPMVWEVAQVLQVEQEEIPCFLDEIYCSPGTVDLMVEEFRNRYIDHAAEIWVYGDSTGSGRTAQTGRSYYDLVRLAFRGYSSPIRFKVPLKNPDVRDRLNAFNLKLRNPDGLPTCFIHATKCPNLLRDMAEVVTKEDGKRIVKETRKENPYFYRTHASDAAGYFIYREWPVRREVVKQFVRPRPKPIYRRILGDL